MDGPEAMTDSSCPRRRFESEVPVRKKYKRVGSRRVGILFSSFFSITFILTQISHKLLDPLSKSYREKHLRLQSQSSSRPTHKTYIHIHTQRHKVLHLIYFDITFLSSTYLLHSTSIP
jgi:hypothetical protein